MTMSQPDKHASGAMARETARTDQLAFVQSAEKAAQWFTGRLADKGWSPCRADVECARNAILDATKAARALSAISAPEEQRDRCGCPACAESGIDHESDCAVHRSPAMLNGPCDCAPGSEPQQEGLAGRLAELREACAKVAEAMPSLVSISPAHARGLKGSDVAEAIRAIDLSALALHAPSQPLPQEGGRVPDNSPCPLLGRFPPQVCPKCGMTNNNTCPAGDEEIG